MWRPCRPSWAANGPAPWWSRRWPRLPPVWWRLGVRRLVVAGGETSGAVVQRLGVATLRIGPQIDPGVPWTVSLGEPRLALALKSGNFGGADFFEKALAMVR